LATLLPPVPNTSIGDATTNVSKNLSIIQPPLQMIEATVATTTSRRNDHPLPTARTATTLVAPSVKAFINHQNGGGPTTWSRAIIKQMLTPTST
jgi:hypothetical protein